MPDVTWIVPTVTGREESLERSLVYPNARDDTEVRIFRDEHTCGSAWVQGALEAQGDYIYFAADDIEPHPGFIEAMTEAIDQRQHPAALVLLPDGTKQSCGGAGSDVCHGDCRDWQFVEWSPTPFIHIEWWYEYLVQHSDELAALHYSSDRLVSWLLAKHGIPSVMRRPAVITHYNEIAGRRWTAGEDGNEFERYRLASLI